MSSLDNLVQDHIANHRCAPQWRSVMAAMVDALLTGLSTDARLKMLRNVGERLAIQHPLGDAGTLDDVAMRMNAYFAAMDWGVVEISETNAENGGSFLRIIHALHPILGASDGRLIHFTGPVLEGLFTSWLNMLGGNREMSARLRRLPQIPLEPLEFLYGLHA